MSVFDHFVGLAFKGLKLTLLGYENNEQAIDALRNILSCRNKQILK